MSISLIIPCYNEELNIQKGVLDKIGNYVSEKEEIVEVLIVDDGSTDDTREIIKKEYLNKKGEKFAKFKLIEASHLGKAFAIQTGIQKAKGEYVMFSDIDLATPIEEAEKLIDTAKKGADIVVGSRSSARVGAPILRRVMAIGFIFIRDLFVGLKGVRDTQCGFKLFQRSAAMKIISRLKVFKNGRNVHGSSVSAGFDLEFLFLAGRMGYSIAEVPVSWRHVETKNVAFIKDSMETMQDMVRIKLNDLQGKYNKS